MGAKTKAGKKVKKTRKSDISDIQDGNGKMAGNGEGKLSDAITNGAVSIASAAMQSGRRFRDWHSFVRHLERRKKPRPNLANLYGGGKWALQWAWPRTDSDAPEQQLLDRKITTSIGKVLRGKRKLKSRDQQWLCELANRQRQATVDLEFARMAVALAAIMPRLASVSAEHDWWHGLKNLIALTDAAQPLNESDVVVRQLLTIELPLVLARQLAEVPACAVLAEPASEFLMVEQSELLDTDGWPQARNIPAVPLLLATWTRCHYLLGDMGRPLDKSAQAIWEWFVRQSLRLMRGDGTWMFADEAIPADRDLMRAAVATSADRTDHLIARTALPWLTRQKPAELQMDKEDCFSEWAGVGVLHSNWKPKSPKAGVLCDGADMQIEVCRGDQLFRIQAPPEISRNGKPLRPKTEWDVVCDHTDDDLEHLELELDLQNGIRLQRQICLSREDQFLLLADVILGDSMQQFDYALTLELGPGISTIEETETREVYLRDSHKIRSLVLPLGLPEWKSESTAHDLKCSPGQLRLVHSAQAQNMYAGLFVDLSPRRSKHPRTWRSLTIGQELQIVTPEVAVAYRVRIGPDQFVIYRSLAEADNRTFMGQNHSCEFFVGRLKKDGNATELISIEP